MEARLESRFTPARDWQPRPHYWHSPDDEATEDEVSEFIGALVRMIQPEFVVETGTYHGHTAMQIGLALHDNGHGRLVTVDSNMGALEKAFANFNTLNETLEVNLPVQILHMNSRDYIPDENINFAFFDSWQEGRHLEFLSFYGSGFLQSGAIVAFHDTAPHHQVRKYILEPWQDEYGDREPLTHYLNIIDFHTPRGLILGQVK